MKTLIVTTGDRNGIGLEVALKAIRSIKVPKAARLIFVVPNSSERELALMVGRHSVQPRDAWEETIALSPVRSGISFLPSSDSAPEVFIRAVELAQSKRIDGIVTGPVAKQSFARSGLDDVGHTGVLKRLCRTAVFQGYIGEQLNVVLATDHVPLADVESSLDRLKILEALQAAESLRSLLRRSVRSRPLAVLGLNPHAGDRGQVGSFETKLRLWLPRDVLGPLSPDAAFQKETRRAYSVAVALYHDQGLIPFKMLHGQRTGFQVSLGIPFVRTSVDHGTATDIVGKNRAHAGSMRAAILGALSFISEKRGGIR